MVGFSVLFKFVHGNKDTHMVKKRILLDFFYHLDEFLFVEEVLYKFSGGVELSACEV